MAATAWRVLGLVVGAAALAACNLGGGTAGTTTTSSSTTTTADAGPVISGATVIEQPCGSNGTGIYMTASAHVTDPDGVALVYLQQTTGPAPVQQYMTHRDTDFYSSEFGLISPDSFVLTAVDTLGNLSTSITYTFAGCPR